MHICTRMSILQEKAGWEMANHQYERKKLGFWEAYSIGVGGMVGGGIFASAQSRRGFGVALPHPLLVVESKKSYYGYHENYRKYLPKKGSHTTPPETP